MPRRFYRRGATEFPPCFSLKNMVPASQGCRFPFASRVATAVVDLIDVAVARNTGTAARTAGQNQRVSAATLKKKNALDQAISFVTPPPYWVNYSLSRDPRIQKRVSLLSAV